jgi:7-cyano-7-deazaguanine synthase
MSIVNLVSGGLDSTLMAVLIEESGVSQHPLFVNYGQRAMEREYNACRQVFRELHLPEPACAQLSGFGQLIRSGLTDVTQDVATNAFTPGRNLLFIMTAGAYASQVGASGVCIGLLDERSILFPDQSDEFLTSAEQTLSIALGRPLRVLAPLRSMSKADVVELARLKGIRGTYSCHAGSDPACGVCIACREYHFKEV